MTKIRIIDTHTHYTHPKFDVVREELFNEFEGQGIEAVIEAAIKYESNTKMLALCEQYPNVYAAVGVHPSFVEELDEEKFEALTTLLTHKQVIAIGETGLDYSKRDDEAFVIKQKEWFVRFIKLAREQNMPLVIHCRDAYDDLLEIMSAHKFGENPGIVHCFSGNAKHGKRFIEMGFLLGIGGKFLKNRVEMKELEDAIKVLPLESFVLETDAPYLKPDGLPGVNNTSLNLKFIVEELAKLKDVEPEVIYEVTWKNAMKYMGRDCI